ncbi:MAG: glycoside hydrolase family 95 protein, partial [Gammaproteobacteria bacterium]|nr:glycoside hydrolase family 95 protein [Gammaproteobacteria bacterium]
MNNRKNYAFRVSIKLGSIALLGLLATACSGDKQLPPDDAGLSIKAESTQPIQLSSEQHRLWYQQPAKDWMSEALPIGNGFMGAMIFGGVNEDRIQFNEQSLWAGGPGSSESYNSGNRQDAHKALPEVRELVTNGKFEQAHKLASRELTGKITKEEKNAKGHSFGDFGAYQAFADVYVSQISKNETSGYTRALDLETGLLTVKYRDGQINHKRQYFANYPSRVLAFRYENDAKA